jgi:hypothetical protein
MTKVRLLIRIASIVIVTGFLMVCITAGVFLLMDNCDFVPASISENFFGVCYVCYDFGQDAYAAARYYCLPYPPSDNWIECHKVKYVQRYLRNEKVKEIAFGSVEDEHNVNSLRIWGWRIVEPEKINQTLQLISTAKKDFNISIVWLGRMIIITDKHKFVVPIEGGDKAIYGLDWTSKELRKQLWKWGYGHKVYKYDLPSKEQVVAILLYPYPSKTVPPLAIFGDKKLAEKLIFEPDVKDDPNGIIGLAGLYKVARLCQFGVKRKEEAGKYIFDKELEPEQIFEGRDWLEKIMAAYEIALKEADERERYYPMELENPVGRIVFMTQDVDYWKEIGIDVNTIVSDTCSPLLPRDYWKEIGISENEVHDDYIKSEKLKAYFDELGLTKELLAREPNKAPQN